MRICMRRRLQASRRTSRITTVCNLQLVEKIIFSYLRGTTHYSLSYLLISNMLHFLSFKRPVSIGVYGHPSHEISKYTLLVSEVMVEDDILSDDKTSKKTYKTRDRVSPTIITLCNFIFLNFHVYLIYKHVTFYFRLEIFYFLPIWISCLNYCFERWSNQEIYKLD